MNESNKITNKTYFRIQTVISLLITAYIGISQIDFFTPHYNWITKEFKFSIPIYILFTTLYIVFGFLKGYEWKPSWIVLSFMVAVLLSPLTLFLGGFAPLIWIIAVIAMFRSSF